MFLIPPSGPTSRRLLAASARLRGLLLLLLASCQATSLPAQHSPPQRARSRPQNLAPSEARIVDLYQRVLPAVVTVLTRSRGIQGPEMLGLGTGVLISPECHVLTAAHVVDDADEIVVKTQDGRLRPAELLFSEPGADIALVRLQTPDPALAHSELGDSDRLAVGQEVYVIGAPQGLEASLSVGHISAFRTFNVLYDGSILVEFIQTDAAINTGNSGGPVFDSSGRVIGIASRILSKSGGSEGLGFVVAINAAKQLLALEDRAWTGMQGVFFSHEQLAELLNVDLPGGLLLQRVQRGSPAAKAGLRGGRYPVRLGEREIVLGGDLILEIGDQEACHAECLAEAHQRLLATSRLRVRFLRAGRVRETFLDLSASRRNFLEQGSR